MIIRQASEADAEAVCVTLRRSIRELCFEDHRGDAALLDEWLANKTEDNARRWATASGSCLLVADEGGAILAVGAATAEGDIRLNYVSPDARFRGVSKAMLGALEDYLRQHGNRTSRLSSTRTAHGFYRACGYVDTDNTDDGPKGRGQPMIRHLQETL